MKETLLETIYKNLQEATDHKSDAGYNNDPDINPEDYAGRRVREPKYTIFTGGNENVYIDISLTVYDREDGYLGELRLGDIYIKNGTGKVDEAVCELLQNVADATEKTLADREAKTKEIRKGMEK